MSKIQKQSKGGLIKTASDSGKIHVDGKVGIGVNIDFPGSAEVDGGARIHIKLPTWLTWDILRRLSGLFKQNDNND